MISVRTKFPHPGIAPEFGVAAETLEPFQIGSGEAGGSQFGGRQGFQVQDADAPGEAVADLFHESKILIAGQQSAAVNAALLIDDDLPFTEDPGNIPDLVEDCAAGEIPRKGLGIFLASSARRRWSKVT